MKDLYTIIVLLIIANSSILAQDTLNKPLMQASEKTPFVLLKPDSTVRDWTNGIRDNENLYYDRGVEDTLDRLIYFIHGLGGNVNSWKKSYSALDYEYHMWPRRIDFNQNQVRFHDATFEVMNEMTGIRVQYEWLNNDDIQNGATEMLPYAIGHSLGGLVLRDMDLKFNEHSLSDDTRIDSSMRLFWGTVTFATPHAGAYMAVRQDELSRLGSDITLAVVEEMVTTTVGNLALNHGLLRNTIWEMNATVSELIDMIDQDSIIDGVFNLIAKDSRAPISKQFGPESSYLVDTLNQFINPHMPKAVFYGIEEEPVMWRLLHFMVNDPSDYPAFQANEDDALMISIEEMRLKMELQKDLYNNLAQIYYDKGAAWSNNTAWIPGVNLIGGGISNDFYEQGNIATAIAEANEKAADILSKANMLYKTILGSIDSSNTTIDTIAWKCKKTIEVVRPGPSIMPWLGPFVAVYNRIQFFNDPLLCDNTVPSSLGLPGQGPNPANCPNCTYTVINTELTPLTEERIIEIPSDGTVLAPSQMAFPGCPDEFKRLLNERFNHATGQFETIAIPKVNHLQVRNCEETEAAMRRLYGGDGSMPDFFKLVEK